MKQHGFSQAEFDAYGTVSVGCPSFWKTAQLSMTSHSVQLMTLGLIRICRLPESKAEGLTCCMGHFAPNFLSRALMAVHVLASFGIM